MEPSSSKAGSSENLATVELLPDSFEMAWFLSYNLAAVMMIILTTIHTYNVVLDLFTTNRKSLAHRLSKPPLTNHYKFGQYLTFIILAAYSLSAILFALHMYNLWSLQVCINLNMAGAWFLLPGKGFMYLLFMYRLHVCYSKSTFGYSKRMLFTIGCINVVFGFAFQSFTFYMSRYWVYFTDNDAFPNPCFPLPDGWTFDFFPTTMMIWDFSMNVLSLFLFVNPLRKAIKGVEIESIDLESRISKNMLSLAIKYAILSSVASLSTTFFWIGVGWMFPQQYYMSAFDVVINSICIMLMTAYYPNDIYYERLCCCCLYLFVPNKFRSQSIQVEKQLRDIQVSPKGTYAGSVNHATSTIGTMSQKSEKETEIVYSAETS